jgi:ABC-type amino acid transport substrate-binding protein
LSAALFFILKAPDIAITQVAIGSGFLTFLFIVAVKIREKIIVVYTEESLFSYIMNGKHYGIAVEIIENFTKNEGMEIEYRKMSYSDAISAIKKGDIDILITVKNGDANIPKIKYAEFEELLLKKEYGNKNTEAYSVSNIEKNAQDKDIKEIITILPTLIFTRNKIENYKVERIKKFKKIYFHLNPYNSDLIDYMKKYIAKNEKFVKDTVKKYV